MCVCSNPRDDRRYRLVGRLPVTAQLSLEFRVDEIVQPPEFAQVDVCRRIHHVQSRAHLNLHVGVVVPRLNRAGEVAEGDHVPFRHRDVDIVGCAKISQVGRGKSCHASELRWTADRLELLDDLPMEQEESVASRIGMPREVNRAEAVEERQTALRTRRKQQCLIFERLKLGFRVAVHNGDAFQEA